MNIVSNENICWWHKIEGNTVMRFENLHPTVTPEAARLYDQACSGAIFCIIRISAIIDHFGLCRIIIHRCWGQTIRVVPP